jgi:hypothetical protein
MAAAEEPGHDRFGHARRQRRGHRGIRRVAALLEDLDAGVDGRGMARSDGCFHRLLPYAGP